MKRFLRYIAMIIVGILFLASVKLAQAAVTLISFTAVQNLPNQEITLFWETGTELDFAGFYIQRSLQQDSGFVRIMDQNGEVVFYPAKGEGGSGAQYFHVDTHLDINVLYYYRLEMIELSGNTSFSDVVSIFLGNTPTPTLTVTSTATPTATSFTRTPTGTRTPLTPTSTRTKTRHPTITLTRTPTPFHAVTFTSKPRSTSTLTETTTETPTPTISPTETTTLIPLPSLTLLFPVHTHTSTFTPSFTATSSPLPPTPTITPKPSTQISLNDGFLGGIIILLWITLAGFLIIYLRKSSQ
jgi:hypothetical protein